MESAARAVPLCLPREPAACELIDRRLLALAVEADPTYKSIITDGVQAALIVEFEADQPQAAQRSTEELLRQLLPLRAHGLTMAMAGKGNAEVDWLWRIRSLALPLLHRLAGTEQPVPFIEDVSVPVEVLPEYLHRIQSLMQRHQTIASFLVHAGSGQVHVRPFLDLSRPDHVTRLGAMAEEVYQLVLDLGGSISGQHAVGLARCRWVGQQYGRLFGVMREVKQIFDPSGIFNPGKIFGEGLGDPLVKYLRRFRLVQEQMVEEASTRPKVELQLIWRDGDLCSAVQRCNGCGSCRTQQPAQRMCPIFRAQLDEAATPRAKANLLRQVLAAGVNGESLSSDAVRGVADLCVNCKMCGLECDALVPIPKLMLEAKAQNVAENGLTWDAWFLSRTETWAAWGSTFAWLTNAALANPPVRWLLSRLFGLARRRRLPTFAMQSFLRRAARRGWTRMPRRVRGRKAVYFVDVYANYNEPAIAEATVAVLHHHGIEVYVPPQQVGCGIAPLAFGDVENAKNLARRNLNHLADLARLGFPIICSEPSAALMLRQDYLDLIGDLDARLVASQTVELTTFLWRLHEEGELRRDLKPVSCRVGHHVPCHIKALAQGVHGPKLLGLIPGLQPVTIDESCSGMAGTYGLREADFETSLAAGKPMLERFARDDLHVGSSECSACRMQMLQGADKPVFHPVQFLAQAYGLQPLRLAPRRL
jgi:Fe-S oxidoreductase